ncbi:hypothetical protein [Streptococcus pluranimalium]|uniref:Uncharacterized protein n=2 Tax=Streptococcus pluranimalium TaxID=82348 RepID=A0A345VMM3_9STRE|nr:hypothetical protein [Streptococcus pluranimalium]AXJ13975.1 hypothetical protein Sp14A_20910 [Streptococcus pluranimalium]HEM6116740.1 hypothetical protein [Streptococcus suis]
MMEKILMRLQMLQVISILCLGLVSIAVVVALVKQNWWSAILGLIAVVIMIVVCIINQQSLKELIR